MRLSPKLIRILGVVAPLVLVACVSVRTLDPAAPIVLSDDEGILVLNVQTDIPLHSVKVSGGKLAENLAEGEHLLLLAMPAGEYRWDRIERKEMWRVSWYQFSRRDERMRFRVEAGQINYPGLLLVQKPLPFYVSWRMVRPGGYIFFDIVNRSASMLQMLESKHPEVVEHFPLHYSGWGRDEFLERFFEARSIANGVEVGDPER